MNTTAAKPFSWSTAFAAAGTVLLLAYMSAKGEINQRPTDTWQASSAALANAPTVIAPRYPSNHAPAPQLRMVEDPR